MKALALLAPLLIAFFAARAEDPPAAGDAQSGLVIEKKMEAKGSSTPITVKIKGNLARVDSPVRGETDPTTLLYDLSSGKATILIHKEKVAMDMDFSGLKKQALAALQGAAVEKPKDTGVHEKVGDWNADVYEWTAAGFKAKLWIAQDVPDGDWIKQKLSQLSKVTSAGPDPTQFDLPGLLVKFEVTSPQAGTVTTTTTSIRKTPLADSEFVIPADYQKKAAPQLPSAAGK
jgi:Domain of unknown function (DUF4412)